ncbi:MAG: zinc ribbon domain-containing protein [Phycisphaerae bacterium]|nr:zinc ribbon domain-containing protein [Phycisphaerae bacterium]
MPRQTHDSDDDFDELNDVDERVSSRDTREDDQAYCPDCGALIWDAADVCPKCFAFIDGNTLRHPPRVLLQRSRRHRAVVLLILLGLFSGLVWGLIRVLR